MEIINVHQAKTHFSSLIKRVAGGEDIIIAKAGKPIARLTSFETQPPHKIKRIGFMEGAIRVPDDFDTMGVDEIIAMFEGEL